MEELSDQQLIDKYQDGSDLFIEASSQYGCVTQKFTLKEIIRLAKLAELEYEECDHDFDLLLSWPPKRLCKKCKFMEFA